MEDVLVRAMAVCPVLHESETETEVTETEEPICVWERISWSQNAAGEYHALSLSQFLTDWAPASLLLYIQGTGIGKVSGLKLVDFFYDLT